MENQGNIYHSSKIYGEEQEIFETLFSSPLLKIERILTLKPFEQPGEWYDQDHDEWVILLEGEAELEFKKQATQKLFSGDYLFIPAHKVHRIKETKGTHPCLWLAFHGKFK